MVLVFANDSKKGIKKAINKSLLDIGYKSKIKKSSNIFVKINLSLDSYYPGANTSKEFLAPLVELLSKKASKVYVGDSNPSACNADKALDVLGLRKAIENNGGIPINLSKEKTELFYDKSLMYFKKGVMMPKILLGSDLVISSACAKTHVFTGVTSSLKNMFGCFPGRKVLLHNNLDYAITDAVFITKPCFAITDAITGMEGNGPVEGIPRKLNLIIASNDLVSHDCFVSSMMGFDPKNISHIKLSSDRNLGKMGFKTNYNYSKIAPFKPAVIDSVSKVQDFCIKNKILYNLCYKTPVYELLWRTAKGIKNMRRNNYLKSFMML